MLEEQKKALGECKGSNAVFKKADSETIGVMINSDFKQCKRMVHF